MRIYLQLDEGTQMPRIQSHLFQPSHLWGMQEDHEIFDLVGALEKAEGTLSSLATGARRAKTIQF